MAAKQNDSKKIDLSRMPVHVAIIMDGNGRWAKKRGLPRKAGHVAGAETFRRIANYCKDIGVKYLTVYAFSTENWKRPADEVGAIMGLLEKYLHEAIDTMERDHIRVKFFGDDSVLSPKLRELINRTRTISEHVDGVQVNICLNYGGRADIVKAAWRYAQEHPNDAAPPSEELFSKYLYSADIPDPDLMIRPGGECRISNFLLWELAYSELYFTDTLWPDFTEATLDEAIAAYQKRERRFGEVK